MNAGRYKLLIPKINDTAATIAKDAVKAKKVEYISVASISLGKTTCAAKTKWTPAQNADPSRPIHRSACIPAPILLAMSEV